MNKTTKLGSLIRLVALAGLMANPAALTAQETSFSGLFFGDYYGVASHNNPDLSGANGFWARRMYLTANTRISPKLDARIRFEAASSGDFETAGTIDPFLKDLWVRFRTGNHSVLVGLSSSPTWNLIESEWGYRDVEKTPLDLFKMGSSRDFGVALKGSLDKNRLVRYHVMFGNGSSTKAETNKGKKVHGALQLYPTDNLIFEVYADREARPDDVTRSTYTATAIVRGDPGRVGLLAARQARRAAGSEDVNVDVYSVFGVLDLGHRVNLVARWDRMASPIPDGGSIKYFQMNPTSAGHFLLAGVDIHLDDHMHVIPNVEYVTYDDAGLSSDLFMRTTFSFTF